MSYISKKLMVQVASTAAVIVAALTIAAGTIFIRNKIEAKEIRQNLEQGSASLLLGLVSEAKIYFNKAIDLQKGNKEIYIFIEDIYMKADRFDDALATLKEGKNNNIKGMDKAIEEIKLKFEIANIDATSFQNEIYSLPEEITIKINNEDTSVKVNWKDAKAETNKLGDYVFEGNVEEYERLVKLTLHVIPKPKPVVKSKQIGFISSVSEKGGKKYLKFDDVKFLTGEEAVEAARKDGKAVYENGKYFVYDDYYIVNNNHQEKCYVISDSASLNILAFLTDPNNNSVENQLVAYEKFKDTINKRGHMLCYIYTENDIIVKVEGKYTP